MNLIDAWATRKVIKRPNGECWETNDFAYFADFLTVLLKNAKNYDQLDCDLVAIDWEIVKEKKKVVIEDTKMIEFHGGDFKFADSDGIALKDRKDIPTDVKMKMTLEYEE